MNSIRSLAVYAASSTQIDPIYFECARKLGHILAQNNIRLVYGAGNMGLMGEIADAVLEQGGKVTGVIPEFMVEQHWEHQGCTDLIITPDMHQRKATIEQLSDAMLALPGGIGTFEELLEILTWKQLGLHTKPVVILNINGYYDNLLRCLNQMVEEHFMRDIHNNKMYSVVGSAEEVLHAIANAPAWDKSIRKAAKI
ncbi:MAG: TIGR00730 family Rossman fold protein [Paludibacter sp.]|nr:TIGR00730 family Rossman fold protein [Bacteroidales bacterium]MCM1068670.1 TIGR00730 family Rossman fold protein [Prevotella sp.]MCM1353334.1 TIGR00730 family Rossman fold protein [Bacteroides sp.]MCM1442258.1 TIGR00730 family Rossman fold protein [Muribaculum sp.]MCM1481077.1 TIGR00730 family Rossman fold protein [Paludibacter sp.]